jgi:hypothetical protein
MQNSNTETVLFIDIQWTDDKNRDIPNPNCCSRRMPMKTRLNIFAAKWIIPACNQMHVTSLHPWWWFTTSSHLRAPIFVSLQKPTKIWCIKVLQKSIKILTILFILFRVKRSILSLNVWGTTSIVSGWIKITKTYQNAFVISQLGHNITKTYLKMFV